MIIRRGIVRFRRRGRSWRPGSTSRSGWRKGPRKSTSPSGCVTGANGLLVLDHLYEQILSWIQEADPKGLLIVERMELTRREPRLGTYTAPAMKISLGEAAVRVVPMGSDIHDSYRNEDGTEGRYEGRVDITDDLHKYVLYRVADEGSQAWIVVGRSGPPKRFDRAQLEAILSDLLS